MPHFFASDLTAVATAFLLGIPVILIPGYGLGWWLNLFDFRSEPVPTRWAWALAFGLTMEPILLFVPFRLFSVTGMWFAFGALFLLGVVALGRQNPVPRWGEIPSPVKVATALALALGCFLMLDVVTATGVFPPTQIIDTSFRSQVITSLATADHLPPTSMFFNPGHPTVLKYHYVLFLICGLMMRLGAGLVTARMALVGLALWVELAMLVVVAIAIRFFWSFQDNARATRIAWVLLLVGGLDILPVGAETFSRWLAGDPHPIPYADVNFWNGWGMAFDWINTLVWSPHHLAGLIGCVLGCLFLWHSRDQQPQLNWKSAVAAGLAFASAGGSSIYVTAIFGAFLLIVIIELFLNAPRFLAPLVIAGALAGVLAASSLFDMRPSAGASTSSVFVFAARPFQPIIFLFDYLRIRSPLAWNLTYLLILPLNYLLEFGFLFVGGILWAYDCKTRISPLPLKEHLTGGLVAISLIFPAVIWSGMEYSNDFGYRGVLPAQFIFLLWSAEFIDRYWHERTTLGPVQRRLLQVGLIAVGLGCATNLFNLVLIRCTIGNFEQGTVLPGQMLRPGYSPDRFADLRAAYIWIQKHTPSTTTVQENPVTWQLLAEGEYSQRPSVVYGSNPSFMIGTNHAEYLATVEDVRRAFQFGVADQHVKQVCERYKIDYLVVEDDDPVWADRRSYVWHDTPAFFSRHVRVFSCNSNPLGAR